MANNSGMENLLIFGGLGLAAWWVYETYFVTPAASTAVPASTSTAASSVATSAPAAPTAPTSCPAGYTLTGGACIPIPVSVPLNYSDTLRSAIAAGAGQATVQAEGSVLTPDRTPARSVNPNAALSGLGALVRMYGSR